MRRVGSDILGLFKQQQYLLFFFTAVAHIGVLPEAYHSFYLGALVEQNCPGRRARYQYWAVLCFWPSIHLSLMMGYTRYFFTCARVLVPDTCYMHVGSGTATAPPATDTPQTGRQYVKQLRKKRQGSDRDWAMTPMVSTRSVRLREGAKVDTREILCTPAGL